MTDCRPRTQALAFHEFIARFTIEDGVELHKPEAAIVVSLLAGIAADSQ